MLVSGKTDWKTVDGLPIGEKLQTTTYLDGLGRPFQKVNREIATPSEGSSLWGDMVQFSEYDSYGREGKNYLPYTTTAQPGKMKTSPLSNQAQYYTNVYNENSPYSLLTYENNPLQRVRNVKSPGTSWAAGAGNTTEYEPNSAADNVQMFIVGYNVGDGPVKIGVYAANTLHKTKNTDERGNLVIEYTNKSGQLILTKTQIDATPSAAHGGWICVYSIYDDFGQLRYRLQPEAVKYLDTHNWLFTGTDGLKVLNELCFRYEYDSKGRNILKKAPGARELRMIYDKRDRVVLMQDGNQLTQASGAGGISVAPTTTYQAYTSPTNIGNQDYEGELGMEFQVTKPGGILVKQLGAFDHEGNGISGTQNGGVRVAIFNLTNHSMVQGLDVTITGSGDAYSGNYQMKNITPVQLMPGNYVIVAKGYYYGEKNGNALIPGSPVYGLQDGGGALIFEKSWYGDGTPTGFDFPSHSTDLSKNAFLAGTFLYDVTSSTTNTSTTNTVAHQAYTSPTNAGNQAYGGELGMEFQVNNPGGIVISQLGTFDDGGNGIIGTQNGGIRVAIFNTVTAAIVPGLDVTISGSADNLKANHRMKNVTPVTLPPGNYIVVAKGYNSSEYNGNYLIAGSQIYGTDDANGAISFIRSHYGENEIGFVYPQRTHEDPNNAGSKHAYLAGTFLYDIPGVNGGGGGNSGAAKPEWTANFYDELDRPILSTLYRSTKTVSALQTAVDNAAAVTTVSLQTINQSIITSLNLLTATELNDESVNTVLKLQFYDNYTFTSARPFDINFDNALAYPNGTPDAIPIAASKRTLSFPTGSMVRVLGTNMFISSTEYYDEKGRHIQSIESNIKSGSDVTTMQYQWDGRLLSSHTKHSTLGTGYTNFGILTKNVFDKIGRVTSIEKKYGDNAFKTIARYDFDDMGRLKTKHLAPGYTGTGKNELEDLKYSYNIHNNITGINKDYALKEASYDKWDHFFGLYLGYDNRDNVFTRAQLDGHVTGLLWNTQGDDAQRRYDYLYDNAGRISNAAFTEKQTPGGNWSNAKMDFTVSGRNGEIEYDLNGNLLFMLQKGVVAGGQSPVKIDDLKYTYAAYSNKLLRVTDNGTAGSFNGQSGDFKDGENSTDDYVYDDNGNLVVDLNKGLSNPLPSGEEEPGITYNFLDKPEFISIIGKGKIQFVYDAEGNKLRKIYTPENSTAVKTTTYINQFVYEEDLLQYINFEEGRIRVIQPVPLVDGYDMISIDGSITLPFGKKGVFDYYIRDYQENVRMILTDEAHYSSSTCTMETRRHKKEETLFGQNGSGNEVTQTRYKVNDIPGQQSGGGWQNGGIENDVSRLSKLVGKMIGPNTLLKVMAGDELTATTQYYYQNAVVNQPGNNLTSNVLSALMQALTGSMSAGGLVKGATATIAADLSGSTPFITHTSPDANSSFGTNPKAYLNILFFDERFNFIEEGSTFLRVSDAGGNNASLTLANIKTPKNGYAYVYLSNESDEMVYFDNFKVAHERGRLIEENHYYAYGLKIAGISSTKLGDANEGLLKNQNLYNDKELWDEADLNWYDLGYRNYDPQTGRFLQIDPLTDHFPDFSPYLFAGNEPIGNIDEDGLAPIPGLSGTWANLGNVVVKAAPKAAQVAKTGLSAARIGSIALKAADIATDFIPLVSGGKDIYKGIRDGNGWQVALGVGSIALDIFTFGGSSVAKGLVKTAVRESAEMFVKEEVKVIITQGIKKELPKFGCFIKGTPVWTADSTKAIERIRAGDYVYAYDVSKRQVVKKRVTKAYIREVNQLVKIDYGSEVIYTTSEHPFYINNEWVNAGELKAGDSLFLKNGKTKIPVQRITVIDTVVTVYNITVAEAHDYYVGRSKVLVHNNPCAQVIKKEMHHLLPQADEFAQFFKRAGLDIEKYTIPLDKATHRLKSGNGVHTGPENWNKLWRDFQKANPRASREKILKHLDFMRKKFGI